MKTVTKAFALTVLLAPVAAHAADYGYGPQIYAPPQPTVVIQRQVPVVAREVTIQRHIVAPQPHQTRIVERKIVQGPEGVVKTTRIYERYSPPATGPIPPRDIPFASAPYFAPGVSRTYVGAVGAGFVNSAAPVYDDWADDDLQ